MRGAQLGAEGLFRVILAALRTRHLFSSPTHLRVELSPRRALPLVFDKTDKLNRGMSSSTSGVSPQDTKRADSGKRTVIWLVREWEEEDEYTFIAKSRHYRAPTDEIVG